jgi:hypothetical protein
MKAIVPYVVPAIGAALVAAWTLASGPAAAGRASPERAAPRCFRAAEVNGFTARGPNQVDVQVGPNRVYRLGLVGTCQNIDWSFQVALRTIGGGSWVCHPADAEIIVPGPGGGRCLVDDIRPLSRAEIDDARHRHGRH